VTTRLWLVEGTWGGDWAQPDHDFRAFLTGNKFSCARVVWSFEVDGIPSISTRGGQNENRDWIAGGYGLRYRLAQVPFEDRNVLCHSHGIGPVLYQATLEDPEEPIVPIRNLLSICPPPRKDMEALGALALQSGAIDRWRNVYAIGWDKWLRPGQLFDGRWGWHLKLAFKHPHFVQVGERKVAHSGIFTEQYRQRFIDDGHFDFLHGTRLVKGEKAS
jgi:hypothetical protein